MGSNGGTANERVESAPRERVGVRVGAVGAVMVNPRLLCLLGAVLASSVGQEQELAREGKQLSSQPEQKYDLELSFPVDSVLATNVNDDRRARIDNLIQEILLATQDEQVNSLPGTLLDPSSIIFEEDYRCEDGEVVIDQQCVPCPPGTYYDLAGGKKCTKCPIGQYNSESARLACNKCPIIQDKEGVTESEGATAVTECKEMCEAGHYLDQFTELCLPCGHGRYQESKGKFGCDLCEVGKTTRTKSAVSKDECRDDRPDGQQLSFTGECETCPVGTYRTQGMHRGCQNCQSGRTSLRPGSTSEADCSVPVCVAGQFLNATDNQCQACPIGTYQPEEAVHEPLHQGAAVRQECPLPVQAQPWSEHQEVPVLVQAGLQGQRHNRQLRGQLPRLLHERRHLCEERGQAILPVRRVLQRQELRGEV